MERSLITIFFIWILGFGTLFFLLKKRVSKFFNKNSKLPIIINYLIISIPITLIEEYLTYEISMLYSILVIIPIFLAFLLILFYFQKKYKLHYITSSIIFGLFGSFNEMILSGRLVKLLQLIPLYQIILVAILAVLIYFVMAIIPTYYLYSTFKLNSKKSKNSN